MVFYSLGLLHKCFQTIKHATHCAFKRQGRTFYSCSWPWCTHYRLSSAIQTLLPFSTWLTDFVNCPSAGPKFLTGSPMNNNSSTTRWSSKRDLVKRLMKNTSRRELSLSRKRQLNEKRMLSQCTECWKGMIPELLLYAEPSLCGD